MKYIYIDFIALKNYKMQVVVAHYRGRGGKQPFHRLFGRNLLWENKVLC